MVSFGGVLVWILLGSYNADVSPSEHLVAGDRGDREWSPALQLDEHTSQRRLLSLSERDRTPWHRMKKTISSINESNDVSS